MAILCFIYLLSFTMVFYVEAACADAFGFTSGVIIGLVFIYGIVTLMNACVEVVDEGKPNKCTENYILDFMFRKLVVFEALLVAAYMGCTGCPGLGETYAIEIVILGFALTQGTKMIVKLYRKKLEDDSR